jgi:hypothetical protein
MTVIFLISFFVYEFQKQFDEISSQLFLDIFQNVFYQKILFQLPSVPAPPTPALAM